MFFSCGDGGGAGAVEMKFRLWLLKFVRLILLGVSRLMLVIMLAVSVRRFRGSGFKPINSETLNLKPWPSKTSACASGRI